MNKPKIILTAPWPQDAMDALESAYEVVRINLDEEIPNDAEAFCPVFTDPVNEEFISRLPESLKIIASFGVGVDHIDLKAAKAKGLSVSNTPDVLTDDTADLTIGLMIAALRGFTPGEALVRSGTWQGADISGFLGRKVSGKTLGIIGMGRIGQKVATRAKAFEMEILYHSRTPKQDLEKTLGGKYCSLEEVLQKSDIVTLHCDLNAKTKHLMKAKTLAQMKKGSFLINTGRGKLVDEAALVKALNSGHLGGAGLDVYEFEPKLAKGLAAMENVTLLPHLGSATIETRTAMGLRVKENLDAFFRTGKPKDPVV